MDDLDYTLTIINEFFSDPTGETAWYHVPILADANSAEFIRFKRISGTNYESEIIKHLEDVVIQEYNRITEVIERDKKIQNGTANFDPIANFDISRNPDGSIKNIGGAEFKFFPALNNIKYEDGETFAKKMHKFVTTGNTESLKKLLNTTLTALLDEQFEEAFSNWVEKGVLDEVEGKYKYLSGSIGSTGQSSTDNRIAKAMESAKKVLGDSWTDYHEDLLNAYKNHETYPTKTAQGIISELRGMIEDRASRGIISNSLKNSIVQNLKYANFAKEKLREYFYNSKLATSQIIELTSTDLAYYKNYVEFQKRNKEIHGSTDKLNTLATYKGERVGRENERTIYLRDDKVASNVVEDIYEIVMQKLAKKELNELSAATMLSKYGYSNYSIKDKFGKEVPYVKIGHTLVKTDAVNISDAQAYRSLSSYRSVMIMSGKWSEESERAYNNIRNNKWNMEDINVMFQTLKPFVYAQIRKFSYYEKQRVPKVDPKTGEQVLDSLGNPVFEMIDDTSRPVYRKVSTQHKNSEFLLLAMYDAVSGPLGKSPKLRAINKFMEDHQIDVVQFESAVKVGGQGIIDLSGVETEEDVIAKLEADTGIKSGVENPNVVHSIPYSDYGIQQGTPEHAIDAVQLVGTQGRKIIAADFPENIEFNVNGNKLSREEWLKLYNSVITENILESFIQIDKKFRDIKEVEKELQNAIKRSNRYGIEVQRALTLNEDNQFTVPPYDSVVSTQVQSLVNSIIRSHVTKQKIKGGGAYQVSAYGLSDQLNIVFEGEGENKRIKYVECFMPMYSKELFEPLIDPKTGTIDMSKLPEDLRKAIGYRLPTENKYSILPLRIKGFLPQENGSSIMLPVEITTIMGSDFDIDKMYLYFPEFDVQRYNMRKAREDFAKMNAVFNNILSNFTHSQLAEDFLEDDTDDFKEWFNENKEKYRLSTPRLKKVKYDMSKAPEGNNRRARNNMFIDMIYSVLTHPVMASRVLTPGNYDSQKRAERIITIIKNVTEKDLRNHLNSLGIKYGEDVISTLSNLDINTLTEISESLKPVADPLSPLTQVFFHQQNMVGLKSITVYANHNANHALMQHTKLAIKPEHAFVLNGKKYTSLHDIYNDEGGLISDSLGGYLAASVDNAKDPILATLNQNMFTIGCSMLLARLKHEPITVGLLMNQPIVEDMIAAYSSGVREGKTKEQIINEVLAKYKEAASGVFDLSGLANSYQFLNKDLAHNIIIASNLQNASEAERLSLQRSQLAIGELFAKIMASAEALDRVVAATRSDTGNGGVGSSIAETEAKIAKIQDTMFDAEENPKFPLEGANVIDAYTADFDTSTPEGIERLREFLLNSQLPYLQAFYTLGLLKTRDVLRRYFPFYTEGFKDSVSLITSFSKKSVLDGGTRKAIYQDLIAYILSKTPFFGTEYSSTDPSEVVESTEEKRSRIIKEFPKTFSKVIAENPDIANVEFISNLKVINANKDNPVPTIVLANSGRLSKIIKERYGRDWASLLYSENPIAQRLALDLALYSYFKNGLGFGPNSFGYILPLEVRMNIPGYIDTLRSIMDSEDSYREFADQFMYNHLEDGKLIPTVPVQASQFSFIDDKGKAKNIVEISFPETPSFADRKFIKHSIGEAEGRYIPFSYVRVPVNRKDTYYRVFMTENGFVYKRIRPLGFHNSFIEYEYGTDVEAMHSSLRKDIKYDENEVLSGQANNDESSTDIDSTLLPKETPMTDEEAAALAYEEIFHKTYETDIPKVDDIDAIEPKEDFRDADGNPICK